MYNLVLSTICLLSPPSAGGPTLPPGFIAEPIGTNWKSPTGLAFVDEDQLLVAQKDGRVWYVENDLNKNVVLDLSLETLNNGDRGILGIAVDPQFTTNGYLYLLLVVDPDQDGIDNEQETFSRLVRFTTAFDGAGNLVADPASRLNLLGDAWTTGIPSCHTSHAVGTIRFLSDGTLVLSHGDGAHFDLTDTGGFDPPCFGTGKFSSDQDVGSFRSVYDGSFAGKILRIDPATGLGLPDNPFFDGDPASIRSRIWALGLRNPFRFTLLPGSGPRETLFISDVGWNKWEEIERCFGGENFGWPCYEGSKPQPDYQANDPFGFCPQVAAAHVAPWLAWHHSNSGFAGFSGNCASGISFYTGTSYPPLYQNALFFTDYGGNWLRWARLDANLEPTSISLFGTMMNSPVDLVTEPGTGNLVFIAIGNERIYRIRYVGGNQPPSAVATANPAFGPAPLTVQLVGSGSSDPENEPLTYSWDLGDGTTSPDPDPIHVYSDPTISYEAELTVTDPLDNTSVAQVLITPGNTPPVIDELDKPEDGDLYRVGEAVELEAEVSDLEDDQAQIQLEVVWHVDLLHDHHEHPDTFLVTGLEASFVPDTLYDGTWYRIRLEVKDSRGLLATETRTIYDEATVPKAHIVGSPDFTPRLGHPLEVTGHMEFPGNPPLGPMSLVFEWGDGAVDVFPSAGHQVDVTASHAYSSTDTFTVTLRAAAGSVFSEASETATVLPKRHGLAVFAPLIAEKWIPWNKQEELANALVAFGQAAGLEAAFYDFDDQEELALWMTPYVDDGVKDVLVLLDYAPALVYAGENDGSLAEQWIENGNGIVWTGQGAFHAFVDELGSTTVVSSNGLDEVLDAAAPALSLGSGLQSLRPQAAYLPSLSTYLSTRALRYDQLGSEWTVGIRYAEDQDHDSDAIVVEHVSGGFYAQFHCKNDNNLPREEVLSQFLGSYLLAPKKVKAAPPIH